jgi:hypothetical protein
MVDQMFTIIMVGRAKVVEVSQRMSDGRPSIPRMELTTPTLLNIHMKIREMTTDEVTDGT